MNESQCFTDCEIGNRACFQIHTVYVKIKGEQQRLRLFIITTEYCVRQKHIDGWCHSNSFQN